MKIYKGTGTGATVFYQEIDNASLNAMVDSLTNDLNQNHYTKAEVMNLIASSRSIVQVATMPANPTRNTLYYVGTQSPYQTKLVDSNGNIVDMGTSEVDLSDYVAKTSIATSFSSSSTNEQVAGAKAVYDNVSPIESSCAFGDVLNTSANNCVSPMPLHGRTLTSNDRVAVKGLFLGGIVDPISGGGLYGTIETIQQAYTSGGVYSIFIEQIFTNKRLSNYLPIIKCRRQGYVYQQSGVDLNDTSTFLSKITWQAWYPIEYPVIGVALDTSICSKGYIGVGVSGGVATIRFNAVAFINSAASQSAIKIDSGATNLAFLGVNKYNNSQSPGYVWSNANSVSNKNAMICASGGANPHLYFWSVEAGVDYYGEIVIPLGY